MTKTNKVQSTPSAPATTSKPLPTKHSQVIALLSREGGSSLEEMSVKADWLTHSTGAFLTGLKKKGYVLDSEKVAGVRRYRITQSPAA